MILAILFTLILLPGGQDSLVEILEADLQGFIWIGLPLWLILRVVDLVVVGRRCKHRPIRRATVQVIDVTPYK